MPGNSPARLLAPLALALSALALLVVVCSGPRDGDVPVSQEPSPTAKPKQGSDRAGRGKRRRPETYTVKSGDTPASVAADQDVSVDALLEANPDIDPVGLAVGDELEIPRE